jgi:mannose-1-phosphate guanylyltransferase
MKNTNDSPVRCAIVLAAGEGRRLQPFIWRLRGDLLPKQYVSFTGARSMLEQTYQRVEKLFDPECIFTVVGESHLEYPEVRRQLSSRPKGTVIMQPENKDTGPGLFLPLMHLVKRHPDSVVAVFPSDHFIGEENVFMGHVDLASRAVERDGSRLVLLGVEPYGPESDYGYIVPDWEVNHPRLSGIRKVLQFVEKPGPHAARELVRRGGLWNTLVMAFKAKKVLELVGRLAPALHRSFERIGETLGTAREKEVVAEVYREIESLNFSKGLLETISVQNHLRLSVLPVQGVRWSDWGSETRILKDLKRFAHIRTRQEKAQAISAPRMTPVESINR